VAGERDADDTRQFQSAAASQFVLLKTGFEKDHDGLSAIGRGWHAGGVMHDHTASP
jgi:hypothetical protein